MRKPRSLFSLFLLLAPLWLVAPANADTVWIDVRTAEEYAQDHVEGDANIPLAELDPASLRAQYPQGTEFMLYCRSGNRAEQAKDLLQAAGFTGVVNAGGIEDVRKLRELAGAASSAASQAAGAVSVPPR